MGGEGLKRVAVLGAAELPPGPPERDGWPWTVGGRGDIGAGEAARWPRISIVTPSFNQGRFIEQTIRSVLLQRYPNLEYLVMDGGSEDETGAILDKYADHVSHVQSEADEGQADALRQGFRLAQGEILAWINADDLYEPDVLRRIALFFEAHTESVFVNSDVNIVDEDGAFVRKIYAMRPSRFFAANLGQHGWPQQGCFWRRSAYEAAGGINADYEFCMDLDLFTRLAEQGKGRRYPGPATANFRLHPEQKTAKLQAVLDEEKGRIIADYGQPFWSSKPGVMNGLWWLYRKQAAARLRWDRMRGPG